MNCDKCDLWVKREVPTKTPRRKKEYYPAGRCLTAAFNRNNKPLFTLPNTNCDIDRRRSE